MDYTVQDNYLNDADFQRFAQCILPMGISPTVVRATHNPMMTEMPWRYIHHPPDTAADCPDIYDYYWLHLFYENNTITSAWFKLLIPLLFKIGITLSNKENLTRAKANLYTVTPTIIEHGYHMDYTEPSITSVPPLSSVVDIEA